MQSQIRDAREVAAGLQALAGCSRSFLGPDRATKCVISGPSSAGADRSTLVSGVVHLLHAVDGEPTATTRLLEVLEAQGRAAGTGGTWLTVLVGALLSHLSRASHDLGNHAGGLMRNSYGNSAGATPWLLQGLEQAGDVWRQVVATLALPLSELVAAWPPAALAAEVEAVVSMVRGCATLCASVPAGQQEQQPVRAVAVGSNSGMEPQEADEGGGDGEGGDDIRTAVVAAGVSGVQPDDDDDDEFAWGDVAPKPPVAESKPPAHAQPPSSSPSLSPVSGPQHAPSTLTSTNPPPALGVAAQQQPAAPPIPRLHACVAAASVALAHGRPHEARLAAAALLAALTPTSMCSAVVGLNRPSDQAHPSPSRSRSHPPPPGPPYQQPQAQHQQPYSTHSAPSHTLPHKPGLQAMEVTAAAAGAAHACAGLAWGREVVALEVLGADPEAGSGVVVGVSLPPAARLMPAAAEVVAAVAARVTAASGQQGQAHSDMAGHAGAGGDGSGVGWRARVLCLEGGLGHEAVARAATAPGAVAGHPAPQGPPHTPSPNASTSSSNRSSVRSSSAVPGPMSSSLPSTIPTAHSRRPAVPPDLRTLLDASRRDDEAATALAHLLSSPPLSTDLLLASGELPPALVSALLARGGPLLLPSLPVRTLRAAAAAAGVLPAASLADALAAPLLHVGEVVVWRVGCGRARGGVAQAGDVVGGAAPSRSGSFAAGKSRSRAVSHEEGGELLVLHPAGPLLHYTAPTAATTAQPHSRLCSRPCGLPGVSPSATFPTQPFPPTTSPPSQPPPATMPSQAPPTTSVFSRLQAASPVTVALAARTAPMLASSLDAAASRFAALRGALTRGSILPGGGVLELCACLALRSAAAAEAARCASTSGLGMRDGLGIQGPQGGPRPCTSSTSGRAWARFNTHASSHAHAVRAAGLNAVADAFQDVVLVLLQNRGASYPDALARVGAATSRLATLLASRHAGATGMAASTGRAVLEKGFVRAPGAMQPFVLRQLAVHEVNAVQQMLHGGLEEAGETGGGERSMRDLNGPQNGEVQGQELGGVGGGNGRRSAGPGISQMDTRKAGFVADEARARLTAMVAAEGLVRLVLGTGARLVNH